MTVGNFLAKTAGVVGLGLVAYDSHIAGKYRCDANAKNHKAKDLAENYLDDLSLSSPSIVREEVKKGIFRYNVDENISGFFHGIAGYVKGFGSMLAHNAIPFALAVGALIPTGGKAGRGMFSKFCGVGLVAYGAMYLAQEFFGIGNKH